MAIRNAGEHMGMQHVAEEKFAAFSEEIMSLLEIVARVRDVADLDRPGTEDFFREQVSRLCELEMESDAAAEVVQERFKSYIEADLPSRLGMNLADTLEDEMLAAYDSHPMKGMPQRTAAWRKWCEEINEHVPDELEDDELQIEGGAEFRNRRCVLTQKDIFDLDEPVEDANGWIWEKRAIVEHIRTHQGRTKNPANQVHTITEAELKHSRRVVREAQKRKRLAAKAQIQATEIL